MLSVCAKLTSTVRMPSTVIVLMALENPSSRRSKISGSSSRPKNTMNLENSTIFSAYTTLLSTDLISSLINFSNLGSSAANFLGSFSSQHFSKNTGNFFSLRYSLLTLVSIIFKICFLVSGSNCWSSFSFSLSSVSE